MSQIRSFLRDSLAYVLANRKLGYSITYLSDEMTRLRDTEFSISSIVLPGPWDENGPMRGGRNTELAREVLEKSKDPRYVRNPFYNPAKHDGANGHYLFDNIKKPDFVGEYCDSVPLRKGTIITASGIEFELYKNARVKGTQEDADKVMCDQAERYEQP